MWTNMAEVYEQPYVLPSLGTSDHNMVLLSPMDNSSLDTGSVQHVMTRCMGSSEKMLFATELAQIRWEPLYSLSTCNEQFTYYQSIMDKLMDHCFPYKHVARHSGHKPWVTDRFRQLVRKRQRAHMAGDRLATNKFRNMVNRESSRLRRVFYQSKIEDSSSKEWWKHMKSLMGLSNHINLEFVWLANTYTHGEFDALCNIINECLVEVSSGMTRLTVSHNIFQLTDPLPADLIISVHETEVA